LIKLRNFFLESFYVRIVKEHTPFTTYMSKTILCTIDFSASSRHTLQCAVSLAKDLQAHLTVLYTYRLIRVKNEEVVEGKKKIEAAAALNFAAIEEVLRGEGISYDFKTEVGFVVDRIEAFAKESSLGFVVIDKNMNVNNKEAFDELIEHLQVPVVIVP